MKKKPVVIFILLLTLYIISNFLIMDSILKTNRQTDKLNEEYQELLEEQFSLMCENSKFKSREYITWLAEEKLAMYLPEDFEDYAFYEIEEDQKNITLIQYLMPTAEAFSFDIPARITK